LFGHVAEELEGPLDEVDPPKEEEVAKSIKINRCHVICIVLEIYESYEW